MRFTTLLVALALTGCINVSELVRSMNDTAGQIMGTFSAPTLGGAPAPSGCIDQRCIALDAIEERAYELARQKKITWVRLVDTRGFNHEVQRG